MTNEDEVPWLDERQQDVWRHYLEGTARFVEALETIHARELPLTLGEYGLLVKLSEQPDRTQRMAALADSLVVSRSRLTHTVARMEERGLVARCPASADKRGVNCRMTDAGYAALVDAAPGHVRAVRRLLVDVVRPEEYEVLGRVMAKVAAAGRAAVAEGAPEPT